ncbi:MAG: hypothetical protein WAV18_06080 [Roseiarcus sp.]
MAELLKLKPGYTRAAMGGLVQKIVEQSDFSARIATHHRGLTRGGVAGRVNARDREEAARDPRRDDLQNANGHYPPNPAN